MGSVGQIRGVAAALNPAHYKIEEKQIAYNRLAALPNILKGRTLVGVTPDSRKQISRDFPDLVISASRRTATVALWIKSSRRPSKSSSCFILTSALPICAGLTGFLCPNTTAIKMPPAIVSIPSARRTVSVPPLWPPPKKMAESFCFLAAAFDRGYRRRFHQRQSFRFGQRTRVGQTNPRSERADRRFGADNRFQTHRQPGGSADYGRVKGSSRPYLSLGQPG